MKKVGDKLERDIDERHYYVSWTFRFNYELIADNVDRYPSSNKCIGAVRATAMMHPLNWRNFAFMTEFYYGRDFYNIRFYDQITHFKLGLVADPNFYIPRDLFH